MKRKSFVVTAWNDGRWSPTGGGYGLKVPIEDRNRFFKKTWRTVILRLESGGIRGIAEANVAKASFWDETCRELIKQEIGVWLIDCGFAPWPNGSPPRFLMFPAGEGEFDVRPLNE